MVCRSIDIKTHLQRSITDVFFIGYFCLRKIITIAIIKANAMIVTDTRPAKNNCNITNNACISIIRLTSFIGGKPHPFISFPMFTTIQHLYLKNKRTL